MKLPPQIKQFLMRLCWWYSIMIDHMYNMYNIAYYKNTTMQECIHDILKSILICFFMSKHINIHTSTKIPVKHLHMPKLG